jgi:hypothetical protein
MKHCKDVKPLGMLTGNQHDAQVLAAFSESSFVYPDQKAKLVYKMSHYEAPEGAAAMPSYIQVNNTEKSNFRSDPSDLLVGLLG